ncbi:hypothetical protein [Mycobacterium sp. MUNTM1]
MTRFYVRFSAGLLTTLLSVMNAPGARADDGSYLTLVRQSPAVAGFNDFALLFGGHKACTLPPDQVAAVAPGMPAVSAAVYEAAHREICP